MKRFGSPLRYYGCLIFIIHTQKLNFFPPFLQNFVGLSVSNGYIACGSETNEVSLLFFLSPFCSTLFSFLQFIVHLQVYAYYKSLQMPITSKKFGSIDPISGEEIENDNGQFVSSVCWREKSNMVVAANSSGCIKLLQMV